MILEMSRTIPEREAALKELASRLQTLTERREEEEGHHHPDATLGGSPRGQTVSIFSTEYCRREMKQLEEELTKVETSLAVKSMLFDAVAFGFT